MPELDEQPRLVGPLERGAGGEQAGNGLQGRAGVAGVGQGRGVAGDRVENARRDRRRGVRADAHGADPGGAGGRRRGQGRLKLAVPLAGAQGQPVAAGQVGAGAVTAVQAVFDDGVGDGVGR
ncbi:hypothetical protein [Streptomyces sp. MK5]|uniref:hypothetical protein n=1 Tax=Streptomyces sp. MK5 TaxID=3064253 RepID=UPI0027421CEA|nr:hypothetical protein [Streptomyces sp. MK5]